VGPLITLAAALAGGWLFDRLGLPAGAMIGAMVGVATVRLAGATVLEPGSLARFLAYVAIGWVLSGGIDRSMVATLRGSLPAIAIIVVGLVIISTLIAFGLWATGLLDPMTALLSSAPGGIAHMGILGAEYGANVGLITTVHLLRIGTVLVIAPLLARQLA
jgi:uncharacterized protein